MFCLSFRPFRCSILPFEMWLAAWRSVSWSRSSKIWRLILWPWHVRTRSDLCYCSVFSFAWNVSNLVSLTFQFGLSLLYALLSQGEKLLSSSVPLEPSIGDFETWWGIFWLILPWWWSVLIFLWEIDNGVAVVFRTDTIFQVAGQLSQCSLVEPLLLPSNLLTLFCRYLDKRTVHQLKSNME